MTNRTHSCVRTSPDSHHDTTRRLPLTSLIRSCGFAAALVLCAQPATGQFEIGRTTIGFVDASRNDRIISTRIKYPADVAGQNAAPAAGEFPVLAWGHGITVGIGNYSELWEALVPAGYVVVLPRTESPAGIPAADPIHSLPSFTGRLVTA